MMRIVISGDEVWKAPAWETLQKLVGEVVAEDGIFTRIDRTDRNCDYRAPGVYEVDYRLGNGAKVRIELTVTSQ